MDRLLIGCLAALILGASVAATGGEARFFEAEEFDGLLYVGNWVDVKQWYVKRHYHASGGAFVVSHCKGTKMHKRLAKPLVPGTYAAYLRPVLTRSKDTKNIFRVSLGNMSEGGTFTSEAAGEYVQSFIGSGYGWYRVPAALVTKKPTDCIEIEALAAENMGIGDDPEYQQSYIILDSIIITDEEVELTKDRRRGRNRIKFLSGKDPRQAVQRIPRPRPSSPIHFDALPAKREPFVSKKNLLRNSSFELCLKPHFATRGGFTDESNIDADNLSQERPFHGQYCVCLPAGIANTLDDYTGSDKELRYGNAFRLFALGTFLKAEIDELQKSGPLVFSLYLRTNSRKVAFSLAGSRFEASHTEWKRYSAPFPQNWSGMNHVSFSATEPEAKVYVDAMQLERGEQPTDYTPLEGLEVGFQARAKCNIFYRDDSLPLELSVAQDAGGKAEALNVSYRILDTHLDSAHQGTAAITSKPGSVVTRACPVPFSKLGTYLLVYEVQGHPEQGYAIPVHVVENPKNVPRNRMLGAITSSTETAMKIFHHAGFDWVNGLQDRTTVYYSRLWPSEDAIHFYDKYWRMWKEKYDIEYALWVAPFSPPKWDKAIYGKDAAAHMGRPNMSYESWEKFWEGFTKHVDYLGVLMPADELSYHRGPHDALPYIETATRIIRRNRPKTKIMFSSQPTHVLDMLKLKPDLDIGDAIGGSRHNFGRMFFFYDRYVKNKLDKEYWVVGVGWGGSAWHGMVDFERLAPVEKRKLYWEQRWCSTMNRVRKGIFDEAAIAGVERFGLYTAKFDDGHDPCTIFATDDTIKPFAIHFVNIINFLRKHKAGNVIHLDQAYGLVAEYVLRDGKVCAMLLPTGAYNVVEVQLDLPPNKVKLYDFALNPLAFTSAVQLPASKCLFVEDAGLGGDKLIEAIQRLAAHPVDLERRLVLPTGAGLELATFKKEGPAMKRVSAEPLPPEAGFKSPLDSFNGFWATVAGKVSEAAVELDGNANEPAWRTVAPSFIYCWSALDGSYGAQQGIEGFETVFSLNDISSTHRALWDGAHLYLSFAVLDDSIEPGDRIVLKIDADLLGDLAEPALNTDDFEIVVEPTKSGGELSPAVRHHDGTETGKCEGFVKVSDVGYDLELKIPLKLLAVPEGQPRSLGLGIDLVDQDGQERAVLSWTANDSPRKSPRGYGQLVLTE